MPDKPATDVRLQWKGGTRFLAHNSRGRTVTVGAPTQKDDDFEGLRPGEMLFASLAGCSGIDVARILEAQHQNVSAIEINIRGTQAPEPPRPYVTIEIEYVVKGKGVKESAVRRAIYLSETKYCAVAATISKDTRISSTFRIEEDRA